MIQLKHHIEFLSQELQPEITLRYRSKSHSAFFALKAHIESNEKFAKIA